MKKRGMFTKWSWAPLAAMVVLWGGSSAALAAPDCDCDGLSDAAEIQACVDAFCATNPSLCPAQVANYTAICTAKIGNCISSLTAGFCCVSATGVKTALCDGIACTNDSCATATYGNAAGGPATKVCTTDRGFGAVVHTGDNGYCGQNYDSWACTSVNGSVGPACGDKDFAGCPNRCSDTGLVCTGTGAGNCTLVCEGSKQACKNFSDCVNLEGNPACVPQACIGTTCDDPDICDYYICNPGPFANADGCDQNFLAVNVTCGNPAAPADPCDAQDTCDGKGTCQNTKAPALTPCGNPSSGVYPNNCDAPDSCNAVGGCIDRVDPLGTICLGTLGECDPNDLCDGAGKACAVVVKAACAACGSADSTLCDAADTCGAGANAGVCINRVAKASEVCRTSTDECDPAESCVGGTDLLDGCDPQVDANWVSCKPDLFKADDTLCNVGGALGGVCDAPDECCTGVCKDVVKSPSTVCRADGHNGTSKDCDVAENCTGGNGASCDWTFNGAASKACPADLHETGGQFCDDNKGPITGASGVCDAADSCSGAAYDGVQGEGTGFCVNRVKSDSVVCRPAGACACDADENCLGGQTSGDGKEDDGSSKVCPKDVLGNACGSTPIMKFEIIQKSKDVEIDVAYQSACFTVQVFVADASVAQDGVTCAYVNLEPGTAGCPLSVLDVRIDAAFSQFSNFIVEHGGDAGVPDSDRVLDMGGCTVLHGVGDGQWVKLGEVDVVAPQDSCSAATDLLTSSFTLCSNWGQAAGVCNHDSACSSPAVDIDCWGSLYDHDGDIGFVGSGDTSLFATCWLEDAVPGCEAFDYDQSGQVNAGDLSFKATADQHLVCAGGIAIPFAKLTCDPCALDPEGESCNPTAAVNGVMPNAYVQDADGNITTTYVAPASAEMIESYGLTVRPEVDGKNDQRRIGGRKGTR